MTIMTSRPRKKEEILLSPSTPSSEPGTLLVETERLVICRYAMSDALALVEAVNNGFVGCNFCNPRNGFPYPYTLAQADKFLERAIKDCEAYGYPEHNAVFMKPGTYDNPSSQLIFIGSIGVVPYSDVYFRTWGIKYWTCKKSWDRGLGTEMIKEFTHWLFDTWPGLNRIEASTCERNDANGRVLRKCLFNWEGRRRGAIEKNRAVMDEVRFGLLRSDME